MRASALSGFGSCAVLPSYPGMCGMVLFLAQFRNDFQHDSSLIMDIGFLIPPTSVFLATQLTSRVLVDRSLAKVQMLMGTMSSTLGPPLASTPYPQVPVSLMLIGMVCVSRSSA